jgi:hypothetical protein
MKISPNFLHYCRKLSIFALEHWQYGFSEGAGVTFVGILTSVCCYSELL